ncbi:hypothetical protein OH77DRAFT_171065 [Trametes cingulata]|nr:hypothetical protein OH77DRAFT_171065 [Trametes cingulata]
MIDYPSLSFSPRALCSPLSGPLPPRARGGPAESPPRKTFARIAPSRTAQETATSTLALQQLFLVLETRPSAQEIRLLHRPGHSSAYDYDAASDSHTVYEPRTPSHHPRDRMFNQMCDMTFSEINLFPSGGILAQHLPQVPNRHSVYSTTSVLEPHHQKEGDLPQSRRSYWSSSSNSPGESSQGYVVLPLAARQQNRIRSHTAERHVSAKRAFPDAQTPRARRIKRPSASEPNSLCPRGSTLHGYGSVSMRAYPTL